MMEPCVSCFYLCTHCIEYVFKKSSVWIDIFQRATQRTRILLIDNIESGGSPSVICCITSSIKFVHFLSHVNIVTRVQSFNLADKILATLPSPLFRFPLRWRREQNLQLSKDLKISKSFKLRKASGYKKYQLNFTKEISLFKADDPELLTIRRPISLLFMQVLSERVMKNRPRSVCRAYRSTQRLFCVKYLFGEANMALKFSLGWGRIKISRWPFHSWTIFEAFLINSLYSQIHFFIFQSPS